MTERIYHLAPEPELLRACDGDWYRPPRLPEEGFVHCASRAVLLSVARDYYGDHPDPIWVLALDPERLAADVRWEAAAPLPGAGRAHLDEAASFPHVYGPIELGAVVGLARLERDGSDFAWPEGLG